jgi:hypothetical protein
MSASIWNPSTYPRFDTLAYLRQDATVEEWQNALDNYYFIFAYPEAVYTFTNELRVPAGRTIFLQKATVQFNVVGNLYGFFVENDVTITNGKISHINTTDEPGVNGSFRSCVTVGSFNAGPGVGRKGVLLDRLELTTVRPDGQCVSYYADSCFLEIIRCTVTNLGTAKNGIAAHWSLETGTPADGTRHPSMIKIIQNKFVDFVVGVYTSAAYNIAIEQNKFVDCETGINLYRGDYSNVYPIQGDADLIAKNFSVKFNTILNASIGIEVDGVEGIPAAQDIVEAEITWNSIIGSSTGVSTDKAIAIRGCADLGIYHNTFKNYAGYGIDINGTAKNIKIKYNKFSTCGQAAVWSRDGDLIDFVVIAENQFFLNAADNAASDKPHIRICSTATNWSVYGNKFGAVGETATVSVLMTPGHLNTALYDNHTAYLAAGYAYRTSGATSLSTTASSRMDFRNNTAAVGIIVYDGSPCSEIFGPLANLKVYNDAAPGVGTWSVGDRVERVTRTVGQPKAWSCTVAGTPGTWVSEGNL